MIYDIFVAICVWSFVGYFATQILRDNYWFVFKAPNKVVIWAVILAGPIVWCEVWQA